LGECYENGLGVEKNSVEASKWLNIAAGNATDMNSRNKFLAQRDEVAHGISNRELAKVRQQSKIETESVQAAEAARAKAARIDAEQFAQAQAVERARQEAATKAEHNAKIQARKQAVIEAKAVKLKAQQEAKAKVRAEAERRKAVRKVLTLAAKQAKKGALAASSKQKSISTVTPQISPIVEHDHPEIGKPEQHTEPIDAQPGPEKQIIVEPKLESTITVPAQISPIVQPDQAETDKPEHNTEPNDALIDSEIQDITDVPSKVEAGQATSENSTEIDTKTKH
jgi:hypothetical protein